MSRLALVIGNSEYQDPKLARLVTPVEDVTDLAKVLRASDIGSFDDVRVLIDKSVLEVRRVIARFFTEKQPDDLLLLYFSGHGVRDDRGLLYLAVQDTEHDLLNATAIPAAFVTDEMDRSRSRRQVLILDCCHSGAFSHGAKGVPGMGVGTGAAFEGTGFGRMVLTATDATQFAWEGDQVIGEADNSVFTRYLVEGLRTGQADVDGDGRITLDELYDYVYAQVVQTTSKQTPRKFTYNQQGDVVIARNPRPTVKPAELPAELRQAIENPLSGVRDGAVRELERLLGSSHRGLSQAAFEALQSLAADDSHRVSQSAQAALAAHAQRQPPSEAVGIQRQAGQQAEPARGAPDAAATEAEKVHAEQVARDQIEGDRLGREQSTQEPLAPELAEQRSVVSGSPTPAHLLTESRSQLNRLADGWATNLWLALLLAVGGSMLASYFYAPIAGLGQSLWAADLLGGVTTGLAISLALRMRSSLQWASVLALSAFWAAAGIFGGWVIRSLADNIDVVTAWIYGLALIGALRGAATAFALARQFRRSALTPSLLVIVAGWILGTVLPGLVFSQTAYWASPTNFSILLWSTLEAVVGSSVMLWQVKSVHSS